MRCACSGRRYLRHRLRRRRSPPRFQRGGGDSDSDPSARHFIAATHGPPNPAPDPASPKALQVQEPQPQQQLKIPFHVRGWGSNIGQNNRGVALGIVDAKQSIVQVLNLPPQPNTYRLPPPDLERTDNTRPFAADIVIDGVKEPTPYCLWVYLETTPEGRPRGVVQVPVVVVP